MGCSLLFLLGLVWTIVVAEVAWVDETMVKRIIESLNETRLEKLRVICDEVGNDCQSSCKEHCEKLITPFTEAEIKARSTTTLGLSMSQSQHDEMLRLLTRCLRAVSHLCYMPISVVMRYEHTENSCVREHSGFGSAAGWLIRVTARDTHVADGNLSLLLRSRHHVLADPMRCPIEDLYYDVGLGGDDINCRISAAGLSSSRLVLATRVYEESRLEIDISHLLPNLYYGTVITVRPRNNCVFSLGDIYERISGSLTVHGAMHFVMKAPDAAASRFLPLLCILPAILIFT